jgi:hypothetical protein
MKGSSFHCGNAGRSKGRHGGEDNLMLQGHDNMINCSSTNHTADDGSEECAHKHLLAEGGSMIAKTEAREDISSEVPEQQPMNGYWAVMNLEQLATAYLDLEDGQDESKELSDVCEHIYSSQTPDHATNSIHVVHCGCKRHSEILAESEGHKRNKNLSLLLVSRDSGNELAWGTLLCDTELEQRSKVTSTLYSISSKSDFLSIDSKSTSEDWGHVVPSKELKENDQKLSTLQDILLTGSTFCLQRANLKVIPTSLGPTAHLLCPPVIPRLITPCFAASLNRIASLLSHIIALLSG